MGVICGRTAPARPQVARVGWLFAAILVLVAASVAGLVIGSHPVAIRTVWEAITNYDPTNNDHLVVLASRLPRTVLGIVVGIALGLAGALMQALTRNPLADPGILGINVGASTAVVMAIAWLGVNSVLGYLWFAFAGAAIAAVVVYLLGSAHRSAATPARMALAGAAVSVTLTALNQMVLISNEATFATFRYWTVGTLQGRGLDVALTVAPFVLAGVMLTVVLIRPLNMVTLGDESARALGARVSTTRAGAAVAVVLLAGAGTAAAGPIAFVGLAAPHLARMIVGSDLRRLVPAVLVIAPAILLLGDVAGRAAVAPAELQTGLAAAIIGGAVFVAMVRSRKAVAL